MRPLQTNIRILLRLLKCLSLPRICNLFQLYISYFISGLSRKPYLIGMPWSISVEPTNMCNLSCPECPTGTKGLSRAKGNIDQSLFDNIIKGAGKKAFFLNLYFQGEPFLNRNLINLIKTAKQNRFFISCATNAHFISSENVTEIVSSGLDQLIISFDGTTQESYEKYRVGGNLELVRNAIRMLVEEKNNQQQKYPIIVLQFLVLKQNEHQISESKLMAKSFKVDRIVFKTAQLYDLKQDNPYLPQNPKYSRYIQNPDGTLKLKAIGKNRCWKMWSSCVITWDGKIVPCCFDKDAAFCYGNLESNNFEEIWFGEKSKSFKGRILKNRKAINICTNCTES